MVRIEVKRARWLAASLIGIAIGLHGARPENLRADQYGVLPPEALALAEEYDADYPLDSQLQSPWSQSDTGYEELPSVGSACAECGGGSCNPPLWYWENNVRVMNRSRVRGTLLAVDAFVPSTRMTTRNITFDIAAGYDTTIGHYLGRDSDNRDHFVEFTFWGLNSWFQSHSVTASRRYDDVVNGAQYGSLVSPFPVTVAGFNGADMQSIVYSSDVNNFELNARISPRGRPDRMVLKPNGQWQRECQPGQFWSYLFGLRALSLDEVFGWSSSGTVTDLGTLVSTPVTGDYDINTHNDMVGIQIGTEVMFRKCRYEWGARAKAAPMVNFSDQISRVTTTGAAGDPLATGDLNTVRFAKNDGLAFIGEVSLLGTWRVSDVLIAHAGYHFAWITGLARAGEQINYQTNPPARLNTNGHVFDSGLTLGVEAVW